MVILVLIFIIYLRRNYYYQWFYFTSLSSTMPFGSIYQLNRVRCSLASFTQSHCSLASLYVATWLHSSPTCYFYHRLQKNIHIILIDRTHDSNRCLHSNFSDWTIIFRVIAIRLFQTWRGPKKFRVS